MNIFNFSVKKFKYIEKFKLIFILNKVLIYLLLYK